MNILTKLQSKACTEPCSFSSLFNQPYSKDVHYISQARHIAHSTCQCQMSLYTGFFTRIFPCVWEAPPITDVIRRNYFRAFPSVSHTVFRASQLPEMSLKQPLDPVIIKSRGVHMNILTKVQSRACTEPSSFSSLFNQPYSKDIHYISPARHIAHSTTSVSNVIIYQVFSQEYFLVFGKHHQLLM